MNKFKVGDRVMGSAYGISVGLPKGVVGVIRLVHQQQYYTVKFEEKLWPAHGVEAIVTLYHTEIQHAGGPW